MSVIPSPAVEVAPPPCAPTPPSAERPAGAPRAAINPHVSTSAVRPSEPNRLLDAIPQVRWILFGVVALLLIGSFNAKWRIGRDSAAYRGLGHQLATTGKYLFRDKHGQTRYIEQQDTRYPGLPIMLAGVEKTVGPSDAAAVSLIVLFGVAALVLTYRLAGPGLPLWLAVAATVGLGINPKFIRHVHSVLSDVPFLVGVLVTFLGFDRLVRAKGAGARVVWMAVLVVGLVFSASMRPTFWVLALALLVTCVWGLVGRTHRNGAPEDARGRRIACAMTLALLVVASTVFFLVVDLRGKKVGQGGYEQKVLSRLTDFERRILSTLPGNAHEMFEQTIPESFFGTQFGGGFIPVGGGRRVGLSTIFSLLVIASAIWLVRTNVLWGVFTIGSIITMCCLGSVPRYFVMILPFLLIGWCLFVAGLGRFMARWQLAEVAAFCGLGMIVMPNIVMCGDVAREQHGLSRGMTYVGFEKSYLRGDWAAARPVAEMIRRNVSPQQRVIGPEATVLTYLSDREVHALGKLLPKRDKGSWVSRIRALGFTYAVFPDGRGAELYNDKDKITAMLIKAGVLRPTKVIARSAGYKLCEFEVVSKKGRAAVAAATSQTPATGAARKSKKSRTAQVASGGTGGATKPAATQPSRRKRRPAATTAPAAATRTVQGASTTTTQPTRRRRARAATQPTTQSLIAPTGAPGSISQPATAPTRRPRRRPSTGPTTKPATVPAAVSPQGADRLAQPVACAHDSGRSRAGA